MNFTDRTEQLPVPWYWTDQDLTDQLSAELGSRHVLYGLKVETMARREDNDDVLFRVFKTDFEFAVVHLTWSGIIDEEGRWPITITYKDWNDLFENRIEPDSEFYK